MHGGDIFAVAEANGWDWREVYDFSASINPLGPAPGVRAAICQAIDRIAHYPEREPVKLREALARVFGVYPENIILGNGATELLFFVARVFPSIPVTLAQPAFSEFRRAFPDAATADLEGPETWAKEGLLILTRPANPTGWSFPLDVLAEHLRRSNGHTLVDESFLEFSGLPSVATLLEQFPRLLILRSLTKFYALPGLRIGALISSGEAVERWRRQREPWQVNVLAEQAAMAALNDASHAKRSIEFVQQERTWLHKQLAELPKAQPQQNDANFLYVRLAYRAQLLCDFLFEQKILIRNCAEWPGLKGEAVRIAVRSRVENEILLRAWRRFRCDE